MADYNCQACDDLKSTAPNLIVNGIGDVECASLQNGTGLNPSSGNDNCTDLNNLNDCLIGNMEGELERFAVCEWKPFTKLLIPNIWTVFKAVICMLCGLGTKEECTADSINRFDNVYQFSDSVTLLNGCTSANTPSNPERLPTVTYGVMTGYDLVHFSSDVVSQINNATPNTNLPNGTVDGHLVNGIPILKFRGNIRDANIEDIFFGTLVETRGLFTYSIFPVPWDGQDIHNSVDAAGNITLVLSIRAKLTNKTYTDTETFSFAWLQQVRRKLSFDC